MINNKTKELIIAGQVIALGIIIPIIFHVFNGAGPIFLPMHLPVLIGGFLLSPPFALIAGLMTPLLSSIITGMPLLMPIAPIMMIELGVYGLVISLLKRKFNIYITLITSMIIGRISAGLMVFILTSFIGIKFASPLVYLKGAIITGIPGIIIQIVLVPILVLTIRKHYKK